MSSCDQPVVVPASLMLKMVLKQRSLGRFTGTKSAEQEALLSLYKMATENPVLVVSPKRD